MAKGAKRARALVACAAGAIAVFLGPAEAQQNGRTLTQVERDRSAASARAERLRREANSARQEVAALDARLVESGARRAEAEAAASEAERRLVALRFRLQTDGARYRQGRDAFEAALITAAFAQRRADISAVRMGIFARAAAPVLHRDMQMTAASIDEGRRLDAAIEEEQSLLVDAQDAIDAERAEIVTLLARRRAVQTTLVADATAAERRVRQLSAEARNLRELTQRVAARPRNTQRPAGGDVIPTAWLAPAEGRIARNFGASVAGGPAAQGVALHTRAGAQVIAPASGEVAYAGLFRSYGQVLILNLDNGYAVVLTGLETIRARVGETVQAGQPVGEMSAAAIPAPELYVEVRREGRPIDPARWLNARGLAAEQASGRNG